MKGVYYFFVAKEEWGAKTIRWGTKREDQDFHDTPSHMGINFNMMWSVDSTIKSGVNMDYYPEYIKEYRVIAVYKDTGETRRPNEVAAELMTKARNAKYDWAAITFYAYRKILEKFLNIPMPKINKWESKDRWFCNEMMELMSDEEYSMACPNDVMAEMEKSSRFQRVI